MRTLLHEILFGLRMLKKNLTSTAIAILSLALSLVLLICAGLFLKNLENTLALNPGFDARNAIVLPINLGFGQSDLAEGKLFLQRLVDRMESLPTVKSATVAAEMPLGQLHIRDSITVDGYEAGPDERLVVRVNFVGSGYFETLGVSVLRGRTIEARDREDTRPVAVINETMGDRYWPGKDPIGRTIRTGDTAWQVIGVVRDGKYDTLDEPPQPYLCLPLQQIDAYMKQVSLLVKTSGEPQALITPVRQEIQRLDPNLPVSQIATLSDFLRNRVEGNGRACRTGWDLRTPCIGAGDGGRFWCDVLLGQSEDAGIRHSYGVGRSTEGGSRPGLGQRLENHTHGRRDRPWRRPGAHSSPNWFSPRREFVCSDYLCRHFRGVDSSWAIGLLRAGA